MSSAPPLPPSLNDLSGAAGSPSPGSSHEKDFVRCDQLLEKTLRTNSAAQALIDRIEGLGCALPQGFFKCRPCDRETIGGGFRAEPAVKGAPYVPEVILCQNNYMDSQTFQNAVVHELVHAYDQCRAKVDPLNCLHIACTEIRASALSGECSWSHELLRGHPSIANGHPECVKRRAKLSVTSHPKCKGVGAEAVEAAFERCYKDTNPFPDSR